jgi:ribosome-associated translation inhibitor RaiA
MRLPLEIAARNVTLPDPVQEDIRDRAAKLDHFYERIMRCRVTVEGPGPHHRRGTVAVRIDLTVPRSEIHVNRQRGPTVEAAVAEAFAAAGRRLEDYVRRTRGFVKRHEEVPEQA